MKNGVLCFCDEDISIGETIKNLAHVPLHHEPGEKYTYGIGLDVLGYLIEIVTNKKLDMLIAALSIPFELNSFLICAILSIIIMCTNLILARLVGFEPTTR